MSANVASSVAIRRLQQDKMHHAASHERLVDTGPLNGHRHDSAPSGSERRDSREGRLLFAPGLSSTPNKQTRRDPPSSSTSSSTDTESTSTPSSELVPVVLVSRIGSADAECNTEFKAPITGYEIIEQRAKFTVFKIHVQNVRSQDNWFVFRRYTDFARLNRKLRGLFPTVRLALPPKRWFKNNFDPGFLEERILGLQSFVNELLSHKQMCVNHHVRDFFCFDDPPGPLDSLEESRIRCEALEDLVSVLQTELRDKEMEIEVLKTELNLAKSQKETLLKSLMLECSLTEQQQRLATTATLSANNERLHHVNLTIIKMMGGNANNTSCVQGDTSVSLNTSAANFQQGTPGSTINGGINSGGASGSGNKVDLQHSGDYKFRPDDGDLKLNGDDSTITVLNANSSSVLGDLTSGRDAAVSTSVTATTDDNGNEMFGKSVALLELQDIKEK